MSNKAVPPNPLAPVLLKAIRELADVRLVLSVAIELLAEGHRKNKASVEQSRFLRAQLRACLSGRTIASERQSIEDEAEAVSDGGQVERRTAA